MQNIESEVRAESLVTRLYMLIRNHFIEVFRSEAATVIVHAATARESTCSLCG